MKVLWSVELHYACYGIVEQDLYVIEAPPIARWMIGKSIGECMRWLIARGAKLQKVSQYD